MAGVWMRLRIEVRSHWRTWVMFAVLAGVAGGLVIATAAGARRADSALARHLDAYRLPDATISLPESNLRRTVARLRALPQVQASALDAELFYCARDAHDRPVIDTGPQAVSFQVAVDGRDGVALRRPKLLAGRTPDPARPREVLLDSRAAQRFGVRPGDVVPIRVFPRFGQGARGDYGEFRCDPANETPFQPGVPTRRQVRQILVGCPHPRSCKRAKRLIERLYVRLENGADFSRLAARYSDIFDAKATGGKEWFTAGGPVEPFNSTAFGLETGAISRPLKTRYGWHIVQPLTPLLPVGRLVRLEVAGVRATTDPYPVGKVSLTPAFYRVYRRDSVIGNWALSVRLGRGDADIPGLQAATIRVGARIGPGATPGFESERDAASKIQRSIHHQAQALWIAGAAGGLLALILLAQALVRVAAFAGVVHPTLRALGMTRGQLIAVGVGRAAIIAAFASGLAAAVAVAVSPLAPIGLARELEPDPGIAFDPLAVALGSAVIFVAVVLAGAYASSTGARDDAVAPELAPLERVSAAEALARLGLPATVVSGVRLALARGGGPTAVPVSATLVTGVLAVSVVATALTFTASLNHLFSTPRLYGQNWDYRSEYDVPDAKFWRAYPGLSDVARGEDKSSIELNGRRVGVVAMDDVKGHIRPVVTQGRAPEGTDEILLAPKTLDALGLRVGDTVEASVRRTVRMRIVGRGVVPEGTFSELGKGAALTFQAFKRLDPGARPGTFEARVAPGGDREATLARLERRFVTPAPGPPKTVADFGGVSELPLVVSVLLAALAAVVLAHALALAIRRRRRHLAVLKTLGFDRVQILATVTWQATTFAAIALAAGLPLGVAGGRWAWYLFARQIGVVAEPVTPIPFVLLVIPGAVGLAIFVAGVPAWIAARTRAAVVLRTE